MENSSRASASIIAAAVIAILCALFLLLSCSIAFFATLLVNLPASASEVPPWMKTIQLVIFGFSMCLSIFGIVTGVALIRLRNWARISILIWAGAFTFFAVVGIPFAFLMPKISPPAAPQLPEGSEQLFGWILALTYGVPLVIGIWWLTLFNRKSIKSQFAAARGYVGAALPQKPRCPLPIAILAWLHISSILNLVFLPFFPVQVPVFLFGLALPAKEGLIVLVLTALGFFVGGVGVLKLKPWSYSLLMGLQMFWLASTAASLFSPRYLTALASYMKEIQAWIHLPETRFSPEYFAKQFSWIMILGLMFGGGILALFVYYRRRFLDAAAELTASSPSQVTL